MICMYSPFFDKSGKPLSLGKVKYCHLEQLKDCDEGHHLEYKSLLEDGGKAQLAKEIASFANCEGGWLIVGIDDKTKEILPIKKADYSQKVGKIACRITPMPEFETRFLSLPEDKESGVLIIYVYEGRNAPYICNGSVYVRSGSSKEPVKAADRGNVEYLYERSKSYEKEIEGFCQRDFYYPYNKLLQKNTSCGIVNVYIKNISSKIDRRLDIYKKRDEVIKFVEEKMPLFEHVVYSMESIIFMHKMIYPGTNGVTLVFELYYDWSCKMSVPMGCSPEEKDGLKDLLVFAGINEDVVENMQVVQGSTLFNSMVAGIMLFADIAGKYGLRERDYALCVDIENANDLVTCFYGDDFIKYIEKYGLPYAHKEKNRSKIAILRDIPKFRFKDMPGGFVRDYMGAALGYRSDSIGAILHESNRVYLAKT